VRGRVRSFSVLHGYGFIAPEDGGGDVFVHHRDIEGPPPRRLARGDRVEFELEETARGRAARRVRVVLRAGEAQGEPAHRLPG
jgi:CspA family cold shock protein